MLPAFRSLSPRLRAAALAVPALAVPGGLIAALGVTAWSIVGGVASCDSTAKFSVQDRNLADIEVVSGFLAFIDDKNRTVTRVCGSVVGDEKELTPNGVELVVNFLSSTIERVPCKNAEGKVEDLDRSIKEGERIDLTKLTALPPSPTIGGQNFKLELACMGTRDRPYKCTTDGKVCKGPSDKATCPDGECKSDCDSGLNKIDLTGTGLRYHKHADRCDPLRPETKLDVALIVDHSGSTSGLVHDKTNLEEALSQLGANVPSKGMDVMSDPFRMRVDAATNFIDLLNPDDKLITYYFNEKEGIKLACSDAFKCEGGANAGKQCSGPDDKGACPGGTCKGDPDEARPFDTIAPLTFKALAGTGDTQCSKCWGKVRDKAKWHKNGLDLWVRNAGEGRAAIWQTVSEAYTFLTGSSAEGNSGEPTGRAKHIVLLVDGPDTCTESEDFNWKNLAGKSICRIPCSGAKEQWKTLVEKMQQDAKDKNGGKPLVSVHVVQFQAPAYRKPDPRLQELACRTEGTYQFINTEETPRDKTESYEPIRRALARVRFALSGNWRVAFQQEEIAKAKPGEPDATLAVPLGAMLAVEGALRIANTKFASFKSAYESGSQAWRFGFSGLSDGRLLMRRSCVDAKDCGGSGECEANHCNANGLCESAPAPNRLPCGPTTSKCCDGKCKPNTECTNCKY